MTNLTEANLDDEGVPLRKPDVRRIAIVYSNVLRENYHTEQEFLSDNDVVERATDIQKLLESEGFVVAQFPWKKGVQKSVLAFKPDIILNMIETVDGNVLKSHIAYAEVEALGIPFTGCDAQAQEMNYYKSRYKESLIARNVSTPEYTLVENMDQFNPIEISPLLPAMVKLDKHMGGSIGMDDTAICTSLEQAQARCQSIINTFGSKALVERYIKGKELTGIVIEHDDGTYDTYFGQKKFTGDYHFCSWKAVWADDDSYNYDSAYPDPDNILRKLCIDGFEAIRARGYAKFDILVDATEKPYIVDINPNCSFGMHDSAIDIVPTLYGRKFKQTLFAVLNTALKYHEKRALEVAPKKELYLNA